MERVTTRLSLTAILIVAASSLAAFGSTLRIAAYNIEADINGYTTARPGMMTVLQGIGSESVNGVTEPIDVLALEETTSNATTVTPMVSQLNAIYGAGVYATSTYQATVDGSTGSGNGPNAMIYNTTTLQLIGSVGVGTPSTSGAPRQPVRYEFRPVGGTPADDFYVYVSHYKSGDGTSNVNRRNAEAQMIRSNEALLPADARVLYVGDYNLYTSTESTFSTITAAGQGQAFDPLSREGNWDGNSAMKDIVTESSTSIYSRLDLQLVTSNVLNDPDGLEYISGSYHTFGNNGSVTLNNPINSSTNTALPDLANRTAILSALTTASDHLPVVADYSFTLQQAILAGDANGDGKVSFADYLILEQNFGKSGASRAMGDFNNDGKVSFADYLLLEQNFGKTAPEPGTLSLLILGGLALVRRK